MEKPETLIYEVQPGGVWLRHDGALIGFMSNLTMGLLHTLCGKAKRGEISHAIEVRYPWTEMTPLDKLTY